MSRELLQQAYNTLLHARNFIVSKERMHPTGVDLYEKLVYEICDELAKPEPVVSFTDNDEGLCIQLACNGSYHWQNLSENEAAEFFVNAYRGRK